jgi:hypothetical protein
METLNIHVQVHREVALKYKTPQLFGLNNPQIGIKCSKYISYTPMHKLHLKYTKVIYLFKYVWNIASTYTKNNQSSSVPYQAEKSLHIELVTTSALQLHLKYQDQNLF